MAGSDDAQVPSTEVVLMTAQFGNIKSKVLYVRHDKQFRRAVPGVMQGLKAAGRDAHKWAPRLRQFMDGLG
jgi:homoserine O-acetyltransferase